MNHPKVPISIIIPVSSLVEKATLKRLEAIQRAIKDLYRGVEVIVVEQDLGSGYHFLQHLPETVKKVQLSHPIFNKSWMLNVGAKHASNEYLVFADADMYTHNPYWDNLYKWMKQNSLLWGFGWNRLIYANDEQRTVILNGKSLPELKHDTPRPGYSEGGFVCFYKPFFYKIGMYNECLTMLGGIDTEIIIRARRLFSGYPMYNQLVYHLWHQQTPKSRRPERKKNIQIIHKLRKNVNGGIQWLGNQVQGDNRKPLGKEFMG